MLVADLRGGLATDSAQAPVSAPVTLSVAADAASTVVVSVDPSWLDDPSRVFPITVDPSLQIGGGSGASDAYVAQNNPTSNYNGGAQYDAGVSGYVDKVGYPVYPSVQDYSYQQFNVSALAGKEILGAQWKDWVFSESSPNAAFDLWPVVGSWADSTIT